MHNLTAFAQGMDARAYDDENGTLTENPYTPGTQAFIDWYRGYNSELWNQAGH